AQVRQPPRGRVHPIPDRPSVPEHPRQRRPGHRRAGHDHDRDGPRGRDGSGDDQRHRARNPRRRARSDLRPVLHDQADGRGHRTRPQHQLRDREEARGGDHGIQHPGTGNHVHDPHPDRTSEVAMAGESTVLIVDDEPRVLDSLEGLLAIEHQILRAEDGAAALRILAEEPVAVVISDQRMPGMLGTELLARSLTVAPDTARILLTAFTDADALMTSINAANIYHFVVKPWNPRELVHTVRRGVERYRLAHERDAVLRDLAARNQHLEATLADLRAAQERESWEASVRAQLQRYVSPRLVDMAVQDPKRLDLPGDWREATVLFADIRA